MEEAAEEEKEQEAPKEMTLLVRSPPCCAG